MTRDISIIVPAFNCASFLGATLASALGQSGVNHEVVVVDNGSTDGTDAVIDAFRHNPRLIALRVVGGGAPRARNAGIAASTGTYVGFLDGDDIWEPTKAARHVRAMEEWPRLDLTYSWYRIIDSNGLPTGRSNTTPERVLPEGASFEGLVIENFCGNTSTVVCRREALRKAGAFDESLTAIEDLDMWLRIASQRLGNVGLIPEVLTSYRIHGAQMTADWRNMRWNWERVLDRARALAPQRVASVERRARARSARYMSYIAYARGEHEAARRLLLEAWRTGPDTLMPDRRAWLTTAAVAATFLPGSVHARLAASVIQYRARRERGAIL